MKSAIVLACLLTGPFAQSQTPASTTSAPPPASSASRDEPPRVVTGQPLIETVDKPFAIEFRLPAPAKPEALKPIKAAPDVKVYRQLDAPGGAVWRIEGMSEPIRSLFAEGTRSIWLEEPDSASAAKVRVDLPGPRLEPAIPLLTYPDFKQGLIPVATVRGLMPGFVIRASTAPKGTQLSEPGLLSNEKGSALRFADVTWRDDSAYVRLIAPFADDPEQERAYLLEIVNPDGSVSDRLRIDRKGDGFAAAAEVVRSPRAMPVDDQARVPFVIGLNAREARSQLERAGFDSEILDAVSLEPIRNLADYELIGLEVAPGSINRRGQTLWAAASPIDAKTPDSGPIAIANVNAANRDLDPGDEWGIVPLGPLFGREPRVQGVDESRVKAEGWGDGTTIPVRLSPMLCLDPQLTPENAAMRMLAWRASETLRDQHDSSDLPGAIGRAFSIAVRDYEPKLFAVGNRDEWPLTALFEEIDAALGVKTDAKEREEAIRAWRASSSSPIAGGGGGAADPRRALDRNGDHRIADDMAAWRLLRLVAQGLYNPAAHVRTFPDVSAGPNAGALAFSDQPLSSDWLAREGEIAPLSEMADVEVGRNDYLGSCLPTRIKLPDVVGKNVEEAHRILRANWLQTRVQGALVCDYVVSTKPAPGEWLDFRADVELTVVRPVPDLTSATMEQARQLVEGYRLKPVVRMKSEEVRPDDLVWSQSPKSGERVRPGAEVEIRAARKVPDLRNKPLPVAEDETRRLGFRADHAANLSRNDIVIDQSPAPGKSLGVGEPIKLTVQRTMPEVINMTFAKARDQLARWRFELDESSRSWIGRDEVKVFDQEPKPSAKVLIPPDADPDALSKVKLKPGKTAPNLVGASLPEAEEELKRLELALKIDSGMVEGVPMKVIGQEPKANDVVELGAKIGVRVEPAGVLVPKVTEMTVQEAINRLAKAGLKSERPAKTWKQDIVVAQDPPPYAPGQPNWLPRGQAVRLTPQVVTPDATARRAGYPMTLEEAEQLLRNWDLEPDHSWLDLAGLKESGAVVVGQTPRPGDRLPHGSKVRLEVRVPVPNLVNRSFSQAEQALRLRNFEWKTDAEPLRGDIVASQRPKPSELVPPRSAVDLTIQRRVPSLQGLTVERASEALEKLRFQVKPPPQARPEDILADDTDPPAGSAVEPGATVALGRALTRMPNVIGKTIDEAKAILDGEAFPFEVASGLEGSDRVTSQRPAAETNQERGALVKIDARVAVPNVLNLPVGQAIEEIGRASGDLRGIDEPASMPSDRVIEQFPRPGALVHPRTEIALTPGARIPNLVGMPFEEAKAKLDEIKIPYKVSDYKLVPTNDRSKADLAVIVGQSLKAGLSIPRGDTIYLEVKEYDSSIASPSSTPRRNRIE